MIILKFQRNLTCQQTIADTAQLPDEWIHNYTLRWHQQEAYKLRHESGSGGVNVSTNSIKERKKKKKRFTTITAVVFSKNSIQDITDVDIIGRSN